MSAVANRPGNLNFLSQVAFKFEMERAPNFNYFIQKIQFPSVTINAAYEPTPFVKIPLPGDQINYSNLIITFKLDEDLRGYFEMYDWIVALGKPENFNQSKEIYSKTKFEKDGVSSKATLHILTSDMLPNVEIDFYDLIPVALGGFTLETDSSDIQYITTQIEFTYRMYKHNYVS